MRISTPLYMYTRYLLLLLVLLVFFNVPYNPAMAMPATIDNFVTYFLFIRQIPLFRIFYSGNFSTLYQLHRAPLATPWTSTRFGGGYPHKEKYYNQYDRYYCYTNNQPHIATPLNILWLSYYTTLFIECQVILLNLLSIIRV